MTKSIIVFLSTAFFAVLAVSCQESIEPAYPAVECERTIDICVNGLMGEYTQQDAVKSSLVNNIRVAWAAGDVVYVFDGSKYLGKLTAALDKKADGKTDEDRYAKLSGTISAPSTTPCVLSLVHSSLMTEPAAGAAVSELSIDMSAQSTATVPFVAYATMDYTGTAISNVVVPFQFATSIIKVNCTGLKASTAITSATLSNVNTACKLTLSGTGAPSVSGDVNGTITRTGDAYFAADKVNVEGEAVFQIAVPELETASDARILTVFQGKRSSVHKKFSTNALTAATSVNTVCQLVYLPKGALPGVFSVSRQKKVIFSQGNLWADGSNSLHFEDAQWKSISAPHYGQRNTDHVSHFTWSNSLDLAIGHEGYGDNLFCDEDNKLAVDGSDTTYYALSQEEWQYLFDNHSHKLAEVNGVFGCIIAPNGFTGTISDSYTDDAMLAADNLVFLPAAGSRDGNTISEVNSYGYYWSSSVYDHINAYNVLFFDPYINFTNFCSCDKGCSIRLVANCE